MMHSTATLWFTRLSAAIRCRTSANASARSIASRLPVEDTRSIVGGAVKPGQRTATGKAARDARAWVCERRRAWRARVLPARGLDAGGQPLRPLVHAVALGGRYR